MKKIVVLSLSFALCLAVPAFAAGPSESVIINGQRYNLGPELAGDNSIAADFSKPDRTDISPDGHFAVLVHFDKVDQKKYAATARLIVVDVPRRLALRELWAWRMATIAGSWQPNGKYLIYGAAPSDYDEKLDLQLVPAGHDGEYEKFLFDPRTGLIDSRY